MLQILEFAMNGLALGGIYALLAMAITVIWTTSDVLDISSGAQAALAGVAAAIVGMPLGPIVGLFAGIACGILVGAVFYLFHRRRQVKDSVPIVLATFAILIVIESLILYFFGPEGVNLNGFTGVVEFGGAIVLVAGVVSVAVAVAVLVFLSALLKWTPVGLSMRASAISEKSARLVGIAVRRTQIFAFLIGGTLLGLAGTIAALLVGVSYSSPFSLTLAGLSGALLFGQRTPFHAFTGGMVIGLAETLGQAYLPSGWSAGTASLVILLVLATSRAPAVGTLGARP